MKKSNSLRLFGVIFISGLLASCTSSKREVERGTDSPFFIEEYTETPSESVILHSEVMISDSKAERFVVEDAAVEYSEIPSESAISDKSVETDSYSDRSVKLKQVRANLLTATEVNDFKKWDEWEVLLETSFDRYKTIWDIVPEKRFVARVSDRNQRPVVDALVILYDAQDNLIWTARTDNTGTAQLWADLFGNNSNQSRNSKAPYRIEFMYGNKKEVIRNAQPYPQETNVARLDIKSMPSNNVDIFFIIDATGSMSDELHYLQAELYNIIDKVKHNQANLNVRMGSLVYRDKGDDYLTRKSSLDSRIDKTVTFLKQQRADGGGDIPEAVDEALFQSIENEKWQPDALARIAFLVLDAPAHDDARSVQRVQQQIQLAAEKGIRIVPLVASGMEQYGEYLTRCIALTTNGTYAALTDDSGIGNPHAKPTTEYYKVEMLNDLLIRLINDYTRIPTTIG